MRSDFSLNVKCYCLVISIILALCLMGYYIASRFVFLVYKENQNSVYFHDD